MTIINDSLNILNILLHSKYIHNKPHNILYIIYILYGNAIAYTLFWISAADVDGCGDKVMTNEPCITEGVSKRSTVILQL